MTQKKETLCITWLGTAGVLIEAGHDGILIDPYVSRPGLLKVALGLPLKPDQQAIEKWLARLETKIHAVIVSHSHFDHCLDAPYFALKANAPLIGSKSTLNVGRGVPLEEKYLQEAETGRGIRIGPFLLQFIESAHGPAFLGKVPYPGKIDQPLTGPHPARDYKLGETYSILITHASGVILHHGSAGFITGMYEGVTSDVVLLGIGGRGNTQAYLENVALKLRAKIVAPIHFDNFFVPLDKKMKYLPGVNFREFLTTADQYQNIFRLKILSIGEKSACNSWISSPPVQ
ncbi:MAG: MBL fold metallo-hydrolase [Smithella sp.]|nr:MBL fold metallo-hydrolase [Smithella sp.]